MPSNNRKNQNATIYMVDKETGKLISKVSEAKTTTLHIEEKPILKTDVYELVEYLDREYKC